MEETADYSFLWGVLLLAGLVAFLCFKLRKTEEAVQEVRGETLAEIRARQQAELHAPKPRPPSPPRPPQEPVPIRRILPGQDTQPDKRPLRERFGTMDSCRSKGG